MSSDENYMRLAYTIAAFSPDRDTKNGAVIVAPGGKVVSACNSIPNVLDNDETRWSRPEKYSWVVHAEHGAVIRAAENGVRTKGATMFCPWFACQQCALAIVASGISRVVGHSYYYAAANPAWDESVERGINILGEAGVAMDWLETPVYDAAIVRVNGTVFDPGVKGLL